MKHIGMLIALLALAGVLLVPASALSYWDYGMQLALMDDELPVINAALNQRMATRTGPSTQYPEPGTFLAAGDRVRIISVAFDVNDVPWVQVDLTYGNKHIRAYTGLKRFDGVDVDDIPREFNYGLEAKLNEKVTPLCGPGENYSAYSYTLKAGRTVTIVDYENGYAMCDYQSSGDGKWNRVWIRESQLTVQ